MWEQITDTIWSMYLVYERTCNCKSGGSLPAKMMSDLFVKVKYRNTRVEDVWPRRYLNPSQSPLSRVCYYSRTHSITAEILVFYFFIKISNLKGKNGQGVGCYFELAPNLNYYYYNKLLYLLPLLLYLFSLINFLNVFLFVSGK